MKNARWFRGLVTALGVWAVAGASTEVLGNGHGARNVAYGAPVATSWVVPTAYVYPTAYYYPTSYVVPSSYVVPTVYSASYTVTPTSYITPTSYVVPSSYVATSYYVPTSLSYYLPTSLSYYVPTAWYEPTVAYVPTVVESPVVSAPVATASVVCCDTAPTRVVRAAPSEVAPVRSQPVRERAAAPAIESEPAAPAPDTGATRSSRVDKPEPEAPPAKPKRPPQRLDSIEGQPQEKDPGFTPTPITPAPTEPKVESPPSPPAADRDAEKKEAESPVVVPTPAEAGKPGDVPLNLPEPSDTMLRNVRKPVLGTPGRMVDNLLNGVVRSRSTGALVGGVPITLSNPLHAFVDRQVETDTAGRFAVRLPDGDWDVLVTMPSGRVYTVSRLAVSNGKIVDDQGRNIPSLIITR